MTLCITVWKFKPLYESGVFSTYRILNSCDGDKLFVFPTSCQEPLSHQTCQKGFESIDSFSESFTKLVSQIICVSLNLSQTGLLIEYH